MIELLTKPTETTLAAVFFIQIGTAASAALVTHALNSRARRWARQFWEAKVVASREPEKVPYELWEVLAPHERD